MTASMLENTTRVMIDPPWAQTSFLGEDAEANPMDSAARAVAEALGAVDQAGDQRSRRAALDRLSAHLAHQALRRGRSPIPKRAS